MAEAGLQIVHVSIYSVKPEIEERLRGTPGTLDRAYAALEAAHRHGIEVNVNSVINKLNADHLDLNVRTLTDRHPFIRHFVWNNLDPSMGRAEINQAEFTPRNIQTRSDRDRLVYPVEVVVRNRDGKLRAGMPVQVTLVGTGR